MKNTLTQEKTQQVLSAATFNAIINMSAFVGNIQIPPTGKNPSVPMIKDETYIRIMEKHGINIRY